MGHIKSSLKREAYRNSGLSQETRKISNKQYNITPKGARKKISRWKEIIDIGVYINEIKTKNLIKKINETNSWFFEKINKIGKSLARLL